jgi:tRNA A-37 threonylcarbamoyl transferase component Bud32
MEIDEQRTPDADVGPELARGRDVAVHEMGPDLVLRRAPDERSHVAEGEVMEHARAAGYPVPRVHRVGPGEMVLDRVNGPTMLDDLGKHPWRLGAHAATLADLHVRLHALAPPEGLDLRRFTVPGSSILHLDLHPGNVMLSPDGPVVIDWTNAAIGLGAADVAVTWIILGAFEADEPWWKRALIATLRRRFLDGFLAGAGRDEARAVLAPVADYRLRDRNVRPNEAEGIRRLVAAEAPGPTSPDPTTRS